jgi:hypothetical protein
VHPPDDASPSPLHYPSCLTLALFAAESDWGPAAGHSYPCAYDGPHRPLLQDLWQAQSRGHLRGWCWGEELSYNSDVQYNRVNVYITHRGPQGTTVHVLEY